MCKFENLKMYAPVPACRSAVQVGVPAGRLNRRVKIKEDWRMIEYAPLTL